MIKQKLTIYIAIIFLLLVMILPSFSNAGASVVINEIAWMGTKASASDEWIELYNPTNQNIDLTGWGIYEKGGEVLVEELTGTIGVNEYYLIERTDDTAVSNISSSQKPTSWGGSGLSNSGEFLVLKDSRGSIIDEINASSRWFAGIASPEYTSMERIDPNKPGSDSTNWVTNDGLTINGIDANGNPILGTPKSKNSDGLVNPPDQNQENQTQEENNQQSSRPPNQESNNPPKAKAEANKTEVVIGEKITFDASGSSDIDEDKLSFSWNFGDGNKSQEKTTTYTYREEGIYNVVLLVSDGELESYDFLTITVTEPNYSDQIFINEFIPNPAGSDTDNEWVELVNESNEEVDISGWQLDDEEGGSNPFTIPEGTKIGPSLFLVFSRPQTKIALNNDGDRVRLIWPNGFLLQEISYEEKVKEGWSAAKFGSGWRWTSSPTPGSENILSQAESSNRETKSSEVSSAESTPQKSTLKSTVSSYEKEGTSNNEARKGGTTTKNRVEDMDSVPSFTENQSAEAQKSFSFFNIKYFVTGLALLIALTSAAAIFILKRRLK